MRDHLDGKLLCLGQRKKPGILLKLLLYQVLMDSVISHCTTIELSDVMHSIMQQIAAIQACMHSMP